MSERRTKQSVIAGALIVGAAAILHEYSGTPNPAIFVLYLFIYAAILAVGTLVSRLLFGKCKTDRKRRGVEFWAARWGSL